MHKGVEQLNPLFPYSKNHVCFSTPKLMVVKSFSYAKYGYLGERFELENEFTLYNFLFIMIIIHLAVFFLYKVFYICTVINESRPVLRN